MLFRYAHVVDHDNEAIIFGPLHPVELRHDPSRKTEIYRWYRHEEMIRFLDTEVWREYPNYLRLDVEGVYCHDSRFREVNRTNEIRIVGEVIQQLMKVDSDVSRNMRRCSMNTVYDIGRQCIRDATRNITCLFPAGQPCIYLTEFIRQRLVDHFSDKQEASTREWTNSIR